MQHLYCGVKSTMRANLPRNYWFSNWFFTLHWSNPKHLRDDEHHLFNENFLVFYFSVNEPNPAILGMIFDIMSFNRKHVRLIKFVESSLLRPHIYKSQSYISEEHNASSESFSFCIPLWRSNCIHLFHNAPKKSEKAPLKITLGTT